MKSQNEKPLYQKKILYQTNFLFAQTGTKGEEGESWSEDYKMCVMGKSRQLQMYEKTIEQLDENTNKLLKRMQLG